MTPAPASRSGRQLEPTGPLAVALVAVLAAVGLVCAGASASTAPLPGASAATAPVAAEQLSDPGTPDQAEPANLLELRPAPAAPAAPAAPSAPSASAPARPSARPVVEREGPAVPVVDATKQRPRRDRAAARPARISLPTVDIDVRVVPTGVAEDGSMELPSTVNRAGWYRYSAPTGAKAGRTVIASHVDTKKEGLGPFARLQQVGRGDRVVVTDRAGTKHTYRVVWRRYITQSRLPVDELFARGGSPRLVIVTCGGAYDARYGYRDNVVVLAEPVQ